MVPYLVTAPSTQPITLAEVKAHLRVTHSDLDSDIENKIAAAIAALDAWGGLLGRCIMPQTWAIDVTGPGAHWLPFPEVSSVTATGVSGALTATVERFGGGLLVTVADAAPDEELVIQFASAMPATRLPVVKSIIKLMVQREFDMPTGPEHAAISHSIDALVNTLRWRRV